MMQLLLSEKEIADVLQDIIAICNERPINDYMKAKLLDLLRVFVVLNNNTIWKNQNLLMNLLFDKKY